MRHSPLVITLFVLPMLAVLIGLGVWQLDRLSWKRDIIAAMEQRMGEAPLVLDEVLTLPADERPWRPVRVLGTFLNDREMPLYRPAVDGGDVGYHIITPLLLADGRAVLVNRGWVPPEKRLAESRSGSPAGQVWVTGIVREFSERTAFANDNDPSAGEWYWIDPDAMAAAADVPLLPIVVVADQGSDPQQLPRGGQVRLDLPNHHLQYALTWFALAGVLLVIYGILLFRTMRRKGSP
ncbi:MAG: SURF1 family protein [Pseudomonadota bacterium]